MEVAIPMVSSPSRDFNFSSAYNSPRVSAPSSPKRFGSHYFSAPSSPTRASAFYQEFNNYIDSRYNWEQEEEKSKSSETAASIDVDEEEEAATNNDGFEFEFDFSRDSDSASAADELFDGGKIKPLKPPPRLEMRGSRLSYHPPSSPKSSSPIARIRQAFSPKRRNEVDPFEVAIEQSRKSFGGVTAQPQARGRERERERETSTAAVSVYSSRKISRSLSPYRPPSSSTSGLQHHQEQPQQLKISKPTPSIPKSASGSSSKRWSFRDFLLFRSASEGRASERDPLRKFSMHSKRNNGEDCSSFRSVESTSSMRKSRVSAHELHYRSNRAVAEEMKRKTVLPYKQGLFSWFRI